MRVGAGKVLGKKYRFCVWGPFLEKMELVIASQRGKKLTMEKDPNGYWSVLSENIEDGCLYGFLLDGKIERPDPASHCQPQGVHGPSQVIDHDSFKWEDKDWNGIELESMILYELHIGTFTPEGTFESIIPRIDKLVELGVNAVEIMPVSQFPGERNWGYDGAYPFAVQYSYGGPNGLKKLVNECHKKGMAVVLDVVYNHLGPEGNYLRDFGPYFSDKYKTPWGSAINYDDAYSNEVRNFFIENALHWFENYHVDALRLDALHGIFDNSAEPFLRELSGRVSEYSKKSGRKRHLIAETDLNDPKIIRPRGLFGFGMDAQWTDDFHHSVHALLTGEKQGYYQDFGGIDCLAKSLKEGYVYSGQYSRHRKRNHGCPVEGAFTDGHIVFLQNHDQVGNRMFGERLSTLLSFEAQKLAAGILMFSPFIPMLFMGEEYGEPAPFLYFVSHGDGDLVEAVRKGRKEEFRSFNWKGELPDPQDEKTFLKSKINFDLRNKNSHKIIFDFYKKLIGLRKSNPALSCIDRKNMRVGVFGGLNFLFMEKHLNKNSFLGIFNFGKAEINFSADFINGRFIKIISSDDKVWNGPGSSLPDFIDKNSSVCMNPVSFGLYKREGVINE